MSSFLKYSTIACSFFLFSNVIHCDTNEIIYKDFHSKEIVHEKIENLYFLNIKESKNIKIILTGHNIIDYDNFSSITRVKTYTTIKINF